MRLFYELRLIKYVFVNYDEPFKTKVVELAKYYKWNARKFLESLGIINPDLTKIGIELEGDFRYE